MCRTERPRFEPRYPHYFYQRRLPCTVLFLSIGSSDRSLAYRDGKNLKKDCPYFLFEKYIKQNLFRVKAKRLVLIFVSFESDSQKRTIYGLNVQETGIKNIFNRPTS